MLHNFAGNIEMYGAGVRRLDNDLIEAFDLLGLAACEFNLTLYCRHRLQLVFALAVVKNKLVQLLRHDFLEKSQMSGVNTDKRNMRKSELVNGLQKGSVAADADDELLVTRKLAHRQKSALLQLSGQLLSRLL